MSRFLLLISLLYAGLPVVATPVYAQEAAGQQMIVSLPLGGHVGFRVKTTALNVNAGTSMGQRGAALSLAPQVLLDEGNILHRLLLDGDGNLVFGYDLVVEALSATRTFKVTARPLDKLFEARVRARREGAANGSQTPFILHTLTRSTGEHIIEDGETFALDLLVNDRLGLKVVDYVKVTTDKSRLQLAPSVPGAPPPPARDFAVTNVELAVVNYQLSVDGTALRTASVRRSCTGSLLWFALPEQGRFIFSLAPHNGYDFEKVGVIEGNKIAFSWKGVRYEWISAAPIVGSGGVWNLWVLHDPTYTDGFTPPGNRRSEASRLERVLNDPLGALTGKINDPRRSSDLQTRETRAAQSRERVNVRIGAANSIESLLPKK
ncbi:MAG TPA: hypothetical protein VF553_12025 [Pyrinomonadaceae bacterium]|jgi:hypothetical protein